MNDFVVMSVNGTPSTPIASRTRCRYRCGVRYGSACTSTASSAPTVFHCHILAHEDNGMMGIIDITKDGKLSKATQQVLDKMNSEMAGQHMGHS